ncbi:MAG: hypothetical protein N2171_08545 [Clostridia bacterium]|nr:hypothetical protein [Clostridia bacterium]
MSSYIIYKKNYIEHYFYKPNEGICSNQKLHGHWSPHQTIYKEGLDGFCVYADAADNTHMVCTNEDGDLMYLLNKDNSWHKHILTKGNKKVFPQNFHMTILNGRVNLIYSAKYNDDILLVYCILGVSSQPLNLDTLSPEYSDFFIFGSKIYYTNKDNVLGYQDFSDGKPDIFIPVAENAYMPYLTEYNGEIFLVYKSNEHIIFNGNAIFEDKNAISPIISVNSGKLIILWKSINFIRYCASQNGGATWSSPMRFVNSEKATQIFYVQSQNTIHKHYGSINNDEFHLFGDISANLQIPKNSSADSPAFSESSPNEQLEIQKLKIMIEMLKKDIADLKNQLYDIKNGQAGVE